MPRERAQFKRGSALIAGEEGPRGRRRRRRRF